MHLAGFERQPQRLAETEQRSAELRAREQARMIHRLRIVLTGAGTSFLPRAMADALGAQGAVVARLVPALTRSVGLLYRAQPLTPPARAFVELARSQRG